MSEPGRQRLFFALWPGEGQRQALERYFPLVRGCGGRPVPPGNLHITLAFAGAVSAETRDCLIAAADTIAFAPFTLQLDTLGFWSRPQVVWLGCEKVPPAMQRLVGELQKVMQGCGLEAERRPFRPHVTLLRRARRGPQRPAAPLLEWAVRGFVLVASETRPEGARYHILNSWGAGNGDG